MLLCLFKSPPHLAGRQSRLIALKRAIYLLGISGGANVRKWERTSNAVKQDPGIYVAINSGT